VRGRGRWRGKKSRKGGKMGEMRSMSLRKCIRLHRMDHRRLGMNTWKGRKRHAADVQAVIYFNVLDGDDFYG
jgi:hypothetical protein